MSRPTIEAVLFDFFGVVQPVTLPLVYRHFGGDPEADQDFIDQTIQAAHIGRADPSANIASARRILAEHLRVTEDDWVTVQRAYARNDARVLSFVRAVRESGLKTSLVTNMSPGQLQGHMAPDNAGDYFDDIVVSGEVGLAKPDERIFRLAAERLDVSIGRCIMVDDKPGNCEAARSVGMIAVEYTSFGAFTGTMKEYDIPLLT